MDRRYQKRMSAYWARAEARGCRSIDRLNLSGWFDYWHTHVDWYGRGNARPENRLDVATSTIRLLRYLEGRAQSRHEPLQAWATLCTNTMDNAIYAHSPNANGTPYPNDFHGVQWDAPVPQWVSTAATDSTHEIGTVSYDGDVVYLVRKRA